MFAKKLNEYCKILQCSGKALSESSGLSAAVISRYRRGERVPAWESEQMNSLAAGIAKLAQENNVTGITVESVLASFQTVLTDHEESFRQLAANLNQLISVLGLNVTKMARFMNYDASYLSRIRTGQRRPSNKEAFVDGICSFVVHQYEYADQNDKTLLAGLLGCSPKDIEEDFTLFGVLKNWLCSNADKTQEYVDSFLHKMDEFDLNEYIRAIHFDELKVPTVPFQLPTSKTYYGLEEMKKGELDFFKATVLSKSMEPVFMCSDMPMEDMVDDTFPKKWMFGLAMMLKKGLHLSVIHNLNRPFEEMMLGLESWIPMYMTGQLSPYYLKGVHNKVYCHFDYVSGGAALSGECIAGSHDKGKYYLTKNKEEIAYYRAKANSILQKASALMDIYRKDNENAYRAFLCSDTQESGKRQNTLSAPPVYTLPEELLQQILKENKLPEDECARIRKYVKNATKDMQAILTHSSVRDQICELTQEEFEKYPVCLSLSGMFYEKEVRYSYQSYQKHLRKTKEFAERTPRYSVRITADEPFRNIQIMIHEGKWAMVSKSKSPAVHFVIRHPLLRGALENMMLPVFEPAAEDETD